MTDPHAWPSRHIGEAPVTRHVLAVPCSTSEWRWGDGGSRVEAGKDR